MRSVLRGLPLAAGAAKRNNALRPRGCRGASGESTVEGLAERIQALAPHRRSALVAGPWAEEAATLHADTSSSSGISSAGSLEFRDHCGLCRLLSSAGYLVNGQLLESAAERFRGLVDRNGASSLSAEDADAAASLALAACEAGREEGLGSELIEALCSGGLASSADSTSLSGTGAASLALAASAAGRTNGALLDALLTRCSTREIDLDVAALGELRLAVALAGPDAMETLDLRADQFFRTLVAEAPLDDARGEPPMVEEFADALTPFEKDVSAAMDGAEAVHQRGTLILGAFFPLTIHTNRTIVVAEDRDARAVYANAQDQRLAWQRWKCRAAQMPIAASLGAPWRVVSVPEAEWQDLVGTEARINYMRQRLQSREENTKPE